MPVEDENMEGFVSSLITESLEFNQNGDVLSAEDLAWVDSCLVKDPEVPDGNLYSLRDALLEIIDLHPEAVSNSSPGCDGTSIGTDFEMHRPDEEAETVQLQINDLDVVPTGVESDINDDGYPISKKASIPISKPFESGVPISKLFEGVDTVGSFLGNPFLPSYREEERVSEAVDLGLDLNSLATEIEPFSENIFRVWDLGILDGQDELIAGLNKALAETSRWSVPSALDDPGTWQNLKDESIDSLIAGIADLSLDRGSS